MSSLFNNIASSIASNLASAVVDTVRRATGMSPPYTVLDINPQALSKMKLLYNEGDLSLYLDKNVYTAVVYKQKTSSQAFSLFRVASESEAMEQLNNFSFKLQALLNCTGNKLMTRDRQQQISDVIRSNPGWSCAHVAAKLSLVECLTDELIVQYLSIPDDVTGVTPLMVAIETDNVDCVTELIIRGARLDLSAKNGCTVFHYAAKTSNEIIIQKLAAKDRSVLNKLNSAGESALHEACLGDQPKNVHQLLSWGIDPNISESYRYPIHCAVDVSSVKCIQTLCRWSKTQVHLRDTRNGGTPLHWATTRDCIYALIELGAEVDAENNEKETPLHLAIRANRQDCIMGLLAKEANAELTGRSGNNALHMAIETDNPDLVQTLIVFGANINGLNEDKVSPRHKAATSDGKNKDYIIYLLHCVGASRCEKLSGCQQGCAAGGKFNGIPKITAASTPDEQKKFHRGAMPELAMAAAMSRSTSTYLGSSILTEVDSALSMSSAGDRVLCLDGGGIRGLVLIQLLQAIENAVGRPIRNCFDWIAGTSTGGILALAIVNGKSVRHCLGAYFQLKDDVFCGKRPYSSEPLENFLKREFGETTRMSEKVYPRVIVTGVLADRMPAELHLFRNYELPGSGSDGSLHSNSGGSQQFEPLPRYTEQYVWRAARSSGAAPTYFRAFGRFLDGGLMANNPTLDMLTEIHQYNIALQSTGNAQLVRPIHVVVNLGTGRLPQKPVDACDVYRPEGIFDLAKVMYGAKNLAELLVDQATQSEGRAVERAAAWCSTMSVPYFRFSPRLSEDIALDCKDDQSLVNMLWETQCYIYEHKDRIEQLSNLLRT